MKDLLKVKNWLRKHPARLISIVVILFVFGWAECQYNIVSEIWRSEKPPVSLSFGYEIENAEGVREGKPGDSCHSGDLITLSFKTDAESWVAVMKLNVKGVYPIFKKRFQPGGEFGHESFYLDKTTGYEVYYAIARREEFDFDKELKPLLETAQKSLSELNAQRAAFEKLPFDPPSKFTIKHIYLKRLGNWRDQ